MYVGYKKVDAVCEYTFYSLQSSFYFSYNMIIFYITLLAYITAYIVHYNTYNSLESQVILINAQYVMTLLCLGKAMHVYVKHLYFFVTHEKAIWSMSQAASLTFSEHLEGVGGSPNLFGRKSNTLKDR